jgi:hypothetical protein
MIAALEGKALRDLLLQSAASSQEIQRSIKDAYHRQVSRPQPPPLLPQPLLSTHMQQAAAAAATRASAGANASANANANAITGRPAGAAATTTTPLSQTRPVTNFDHYSKSAWHALNDRDLLSLSGSLQHKRAMDVYSDICDCVNAIADIVSKDLPAAPLGTKQNALETLRRIAKTVILGEDTLGHEVRKHFQNDSTISNLMIRIAESMSPEERLRTGKRADAKGGTLVSKLEWVRDQAEGYCLKDCPGFSRVLDLLRSGFASPTGGGGGGGVGPGGSSSFTVLH